MSCFQTTHLSYAGNTAQRQQRADVSFRTTRKVRERMGSLHRKTGHSQAPMEKKFTFSSAAGKDNKARMLTSTIKKAKTAEGLLAVLDEAVNAPYLNYFHTSAALHSLAAFHQKGELPHKCAESPVLLKLKSRIEDPIMLKQMDLRGVANILWSLARLLGVVPLGSTLLPALIEVFPQKGASMNAQDLANCLWASARLQDEAPDVLKMVPALVAQVPGKSDDMVPQALSNSLWATAQLKDVALDVLKIVPALVAKIT